MMTSFLTKFFAFGLGLFILCELFFRFVIPARESPRVRQEKTFNLIQFDPDHAREGLFTSGRYAEQRAPWAINDLGWNFDREYQPNRKIERPIVAMTGDSQIEGFYVTAQEHILRRLEKRSVESFVGYSLASAGYKLGDYILVARYLAAKDITPDLFIMYINRGDFWRAITNLGGKLGTPSPRLREQDGQFELIPGGEYPSLWYRRILRRSALIRYLVFNARLNPFRRGTGDLAMAARQTYPEADAASMPIYERAVIYVVGQIRSALPQAKLIFVIDADRRAIEAGRVPLPIGTSAPIQAACQNVECLAVDLTQPFVQAWHEQRRSFQFVGNYHWNAYAHDVASEALYKALRARNWLPGHKTAKR
ncbi:MAG: hypothetical protein VX589_00735 [Myxococcota bacterium]|nr:hypothetical protein [Myxococcota bacterium]